jgi:hypothetical protein
MLSNGKLIITVEIGTYKQGTKIVSLSFTIGFFFIFEMGTTTASVSVDAHSLSTL